MPDIDVALDFLAQNVANILAPYQPNVPGLYPNPLPTAGQIPATLVAYGKPIQTHVMKRLENKLAQVAIFDTDKGTVFPFLMRSPAQVTWTTPGSEGVPATGVENIEVSREKKQAVIQVWAYSYESRKAVCEIIRRTLTDVYRLHNTDGTTTLMKYQKQLTQDMEQVDSVYVRGFMYETDITEVNTQDATEVIMIKTSVTVGTPTKPKLQVGQL